MARTNPATPNARWMRVRALLLAAMLVVFFGAVLGRAAKVQLFDRSRLSRLQRDQTRRELEWAPRRGLIVDRHGDPLAVTRDVDSVFADPSAFDTLKAREKVAGPPPRPPRPRRSKGPGEQCPPGPESGWVAAAEE